MGFLSKIVPGTANNCPANQGTGNKKDINWRVKDHLGNPIKFRLPLYDTLTNPIPNNCFLPAQGEGTGPGKGTGTGGEWGINIDCAAQRATTVEPVLLRALRSTLSRVTR
jgi:hypothetical protein